MPDQYWVRFRGQTTGPLTRAQIVARAKGGEIKKYHEISADQKKWTLAGHIKDLLPQPARSQTLRVEESPRPITPEDSSPPEPAYDWVTEQLIAPVESLAREPTAQPAEATYPQTTPARSRGVNKKDEKMEVVSAYKPWAYDKPETPHPPPTPAEPNFLSVRPSPQHVSSPPPQSLRLPRGLTVAAQGNFQAVRIKAMGKTKSGRYRGQGKITIEDQGITIEGRHVMSVGARWGIGILLLIPTFVFGFGLGGLGALLIVEYVILKRENIFIPWASVGKYAFDPKARRVALDFEGPEQTSPCVLKTTDLPAIAQALRYKAARKDMTPNVQVI